jgi:hypothetical protein
MGFDTLWVADHLLYRNSPPETVIPEGETRRIWECWLQQHAPGVLRGADRVGPQRGRPVAHDG